MGNYNFEPDLIETQNKEIAFVELATDFYNIKQIGKFGRDNRWDFVLTSPSTGSPTTFEMKSDSQTHKTGNIVIEYSSRGKPSGIMTSKASYYIYEVEKPIRSDYYIIKTRKIRELIENNIKSQFYVRTVNGGDKGSNTLMYLIPLKNFAKHARLLDFH